MVGGEPQPVGPPAQHSSDPTPTQAAATPPALTSAQWVSGPQRLMSAPRHWAAGDAAAAKEPWLPNFGANPCNVAHKPTQTRTQTNPPVALMLQGSKLHDGGGKMQGARVTDLVRLSLNTIPSDLVRSPILFSRHLHLVIAWNDSADGSGPCLADPPNWPRCSLRTGGGERKRAAALYVRKCFLISKSVSSVSSLVGNSWVK